MSKWKGGAFQPASRKSRPASPPCSHAAQRGYSQVLASRHSSRSGVNWSLVWMMYLMMGLWLLVPRVHTSLTVFSRISSARTPPGGPGGPVPNREVPLQRSTNATLSALWVFPSTLYLTDGILYLWIWIHSDQVPVLPVLKRQGERPVCFN